MADVVNNTPICHAVALGAERVYVLPTQTAPRRIARAPVGAIDAAINALTLLVDARLAADLVRYAGEVEHRPAGSQLPSGAADGLRARRPPGRRGPGGLPRAARRARPHAGSVKHHGLRRSSVTTRAPSRDFARHAYEFDGRRFLMRQQLLRAGWTRHEPLETRR
jgi:hypothetical protein